MEQGFTALLFFLGHIPEGDAGIGTARDMTSGDPVVRSFELAADRCADLTPLVYARLAREHPETDAMFRKQGADLVKGSMLAFAIEAILDLAGERNGKFRMIECEMSSHDAYGTPRELFLAFFGLIADTLRETLGADWSNEMESAWRSMLEEIASIVARAET